MSDDSKSSYDFFVSPPVTAPPVSAPPVSAPPRTAPPVSPPAGPPATPRGQSGHPGQFGQPGQQAALNPETFQAAPGGFRLSRWANVGVSILAVILIGSLAAAIAYPMYQRRQLNAQFEHTTINLPATFNGQAGVTSGETEQALRSVATGFATTTARLYGTNPLNLVLIVVFRPNQAMSDDDQALARTQLVQEFNTGRQNPKLALAAAPGTGRLGGYLGCGKSRASSTICMATDAGAMVAIVMGPGIQSPESVAREAREATVRRT